MDNNFSYYEKLPDEQLAQAAKSQNSAKSVLAARYFNSVEAYAKRYSNTSSHEDLIQEGMLGLLNAVDSYSAGKGAAFKTYANVCIRNKILSYLKKNTSSNEELDFEFEPEEYTDNEDIPEDIVFEKLDTIEFMEKSFSVLSEFESKVLGLYLEGKSYDEISSEFKVSVKSVNNAMQRVRRKLKSKLK